MFSRIFGRHKSPVTEDSATPTGTEATEQQPDLVDSDDFVLLGENRQTHDPPPGYTVGGANAFLPYGLHSSASSVQRCESVEVQSAIDGVPFTVASHVQLANGVPFLDTSTTTIMLDKINSFNWDDYEYNFELERSILREFSSRDLAGTQLP